ncbi:MAG: hypothetical protein OHK0017_07960 [Patescibacteria group bacterium]
MSNNQKLAIIQALIVVSLVIVSGLAFGQFLGDLLVEVGKVIFSQ